MPGFRKGLVLTALLGLCVGTAYAQTTVDFGFTAGVSYGSMSGDTPRIFADSKFEMFSEIDGSLDKSKTGMVVGLLMTLNAEQNPSLRFEAIVNEQGAGGEYEGTADLLDMGVQELSGDVSMKTTYLELPMLLVFDLPYGPPRGWRGILGAAIGFPTSSEMRVDSAVDGIAYSDALSFTDRLGNIVYRGVVGTEYTFIFGDVPFQMGLRYEFDLGSFETEMGDDPLLDFKHANFMGTLAIPF